MLNLEVILSLFGTILGLIITALTFITKSIKNGKAKKIAEQVVQIGNAVIPYIKEAEKFVSYTGEEKKAYVMTKANQYAIENHMPFVEGQVSNKIEELVALTNQVNVKEKKQEAIEIPKKIEETATTSSWL